MPKVPVSLRLDRELVEVVDAMADHRDVVRTTMIESMLEAARAGRQRSCSETHKHGERCGVCGLLLEARRTDYETL